MRLPVLAFLAALPAAALAGAAPAASAPQPDLVVAADGSGDFKTIQAAVASIPRDNRERRIVFIKDGTYHEKVRVDAAFVTLHGQSRTGTRLEFPQAAADPGARDGLGQAVLNINGDDCVVSNLTIENTHGVIGVHAFAVYGRGDRTVITDANIWSQGNDTLSLWRTGNGEGARANPAGSTAPATSPNGRYYHARLDVRGSVDFICPRGWCYLTDSVMHEVNPNAEAAMWHDGSRDQDMKFVIRNCRFDGVEGWRFARHHHDAMIFVLDSTFSRSMRDVQPKRVIYPINGGPATAADTKKNTDADPTNIWGERFYYYNTHREGGDFAWHADNLASAPGAPRPEQVTAKWTFAGKWDPENTAGPTVVKVAPADGRVAVTFSENVTVKGRPRLALRSGAFADYAAGSGSDTLVFNPPAGAASTAKGIDLQGGAILACEASAALRFADLKLH
ncbi:MAG TPA: pectinesterase family protein [Opitutaceae bacterium]|nr:pectinesterase family protein [Opitutaceae bacterium]